LNTPEVFWGREVQPRLLAFGARPRAGDWLEDEIRGYKLLGFSHVVSLLEPSEAHELGLGPEGPLCEAQGIRFHSLPIPDRGVPRRSEEPLSLVRLLASAIGRNEAVFLHCRAGIGRSGIITALLMLHLGVPLGSLFPSLSLSRGVRVPDTEQQEQWIQAMASRSEF
jgi:protein-tyrosine phosphatase